MITLTLIDEEGDDTEEEFPHRFVVCPDCGGEGKHFYSQSHSNPSEYSIPCETCNGLRVCKVVDEDSFDQDQKEDYKSFLAYERRKREYTREIANGELHPSQRIGIRCKGATQ